MLNSYLLIAFRNLRRNSRYLIINMLGLGIAIGFCILSFLNYRFANSYDHWHHDAARIVRVETVKASNDELYGICPAALGPAAAGALAGVESQCRYDSRSTVVKQGDAVFNEKLSFADEHFFQFFDFPLSAGSADLQDRSKVVIDAETAKKYFGTANPIGQTLLFYADTDQKLPLTVSGVVATIPLNSSLRFSFITHLDNQFEGKNRVDYTGWKWVVDAVFLKLRQTSDAAQVSVGLQQYVDANNTARQDWAIRAFKLEPLRELAFNRLIRSNGLWPGLPSSAVWGNIIMSTMLLLTASLNFANMTIAICNRRLREMGVRKVMGGTSFQLMRQMLSESFVVVVLAAGLGLLLAYPICDWFNSTWKFTNVVVDYSDPELLAYIGGVVLLTTLLAGSYPAFYISAFKPAKIFRGGVVFGGSNVFSRVMMGLQVVISLIAVVTGLSFAGNAEFNRKADIGFDYQPILQAWVPTVTEYTQFSDAVRDMPGVVGVAGTQHLPGFGYSLAEFQWKGENQEAILYKIGNDAPGLLGMRLAKGSWPTPALDTMPSAEVVVNQTFARTINGGTDQLIGAEITLNKRKVRIVGLVSDFMTDTPFQPIQAAILNPVPVRNWQRCLIKTANTNQQPQVMAAIESKWKQLFPYTPFNVGYQNEMLKEAIEVSDNIATSMAVLASIAILLSITGLFSLISLNVLRRMREVAVRRVMGASAGQVAWVLNKSYGWIFGLAIAVGCFSGRYLSTLLMDSIFKINIGVQLGVLVWSALAILSIVVATIGLKLWQTLRINPADVLRGE